MLYVLLKKHRSHNVFFVSFSQNLLVLTLGARCKADDLHQVLPHLPGLTWLELVTCRGSLDLGLVGQSCGEKLERMEIFYSHSMHISSASRLKFPGW